MKFPLPLRWTIPLLLLGFGLVFVFVEYIALLDNRLERARSGVADLAYYQAARVAGLAGKAALPGNNTLLDNEMGYLEEDTELKYALICDVRLMRVVESTPKEWRDRALSSTGAAEAADLISLTVNSGSAQKKVISNRDLLLSAFPVANASGATGPTVAVVARDLSNPVGLAREDARTDALRMACILAICCGALGAILYFAVAKRAARVMTAARNIFSGARPAEPLEGGDEFAKLSEALQTVHGIVTQQNGNFQHLEERYRRVVEALPALVLVNRGDRIEYMNTPGLRLLGTQKAADVLGKSPFDILHPESHTSIRERLRETNGDRALPPLEEKIVRLDGEVIAVETVVSSFTDQKGSATQVVMWDVSERKAHQAQREALSRNLEEKNKELEAIVYVASHDLRSPLVNVMGFSRQLSGACRQLENLLERSNGSVDAKDVEAVITGTVPRALKFIEQGVTKMDSLLSGFLRFSRLGRADVQLQRLDMNALLKSIVGAMTYQIQQAGADIRVGVLPPCLGDPTQINQVFTNLIDNGIKYRQADRPSVVSVQGRVEKDTSIYTITDNGMGIAKDYVDKIFEIFHRLNPFDTAGEGLGLTIAKRILERHEGSITVHSQPGEGSTFTVTLQTAPAAI